MKFRQLRLRLQTSDGLYGTTMDFPDGLVVVRADNSMGKSTCVKSILVALGLEAMLTTSQSEFPLTPAVLSQLEGSNNQLVEVHESEVFIELENSLGKRITVLRMLRGNRNKQLVTVFEGPALTNPSGSYRADDYFVNRPGGASREKGFHKYLASFLNWDLPKVPSFDGNEVPLYLQCLFPYFVVEQTRGWGSVLPPVPTHLRIRETHKRSVEFILNLDARRIALRRQELKQERAELEMEWSVLRRQTEDLVRKVAAAVNNLPLKPRGIWPPQVMPTPVVPAGEKWLSLEERLEASRVRYGLLVDEQIPRVQEVAVSTALELREAEGALRGREALLARLMDGLRMEQAEAVAVSQRLRAIEEDIQRNQDILTLQTLGSTRLESVVEGNCPVCHQSIEDSLIPLSDDQQVMSVSQNIAFLKDQRKTFRLVLENCERLVSSRQRRIEVAQVELDGLRDNIRVLRQTLNVDGRQPSIAAIRQRMVLEDEIKERHRSDREFQSEDA